MGRTGKSRGEHVRNGSFRRDRHGSGGLPVEIPDMPADLAPVAQGIWKVISQHLAEAGQITAVDGLALRLLCEAAALRLEALDILQSEGICIAGHRGRTTHPAARIFLAATDRVQKLLAQFGLCGDKSRRGLDMKAPLEDDADIRRILKLDKLPNVGA